MYKESWGEKRICPMCSKQYYDLGRSELECPECGKEIEVTTMSRPRRGRKPGSTNAAPLANPNPPKLKEKDDLGYRWDGIKRLKKKHVPKNIKFKDKHGGHIPLAGTAEKTAELT